MSSELSDGWTIGFGAGVLVADAWDSGSSRESCVRSVTGEDVVAPGASRSHPDTIVTGAKTVHLWSSSEVEVVLAALAVVAVLLVCRALDSTTMVSPVSPSSSTNIDLPSNGDPVAPSTMDANNTTLSRPMIGSRQAKKRLQDSKAKRMFPNAEQIRGRPLVSADYWRRGETTAVCESDGDSSRRQYRIGGEKSSKKEHDRISYRPEMSVYADGGREKV
jgi:hypothetical protein